MGWIGSSASGEERRLRGGHPRDGGVPGVSAGAVARGMSPAARRSPVELPFAAHRVVPRAWRLGREWGWAGLPWAPPSAPSRSADALFWPCSDPFASTSSHGRWRQFGGRPPGRHARVLRLRPRRAPPSGSVNPLSPTEGCIQAGGRRADGGRGGRRHDCIRMLRLRPPPATPVGRPRGRAVYDSRAAAPAAPTS